MGRPLDPQYPHESNRQRSERLSLEAQLGTTENVAAAPSDAAPASRQTAAAGGARLTAARPAKKKPTAKAKAKR